MAWGATQGLGCTWQRRRIPTQLSVMPYWVANYSASVQRTRQRRVSGADSIMGGSGKGAGSVLGIVGPAWWSTDTLGNERHWF